jgi:hypothetical protein
MYPTNPNFAMISKAISESLETLKQELQPSETTLQELEEAQILLYQALSNSGVSRLH